ncbi:acyl-CoA dehydrogenase family protein [Neobacillus niacini]|uniref:acyl-CoA dehydrogenase family protein n=1 Tax=Neobacillus niacini TaxID=86668 RepID=UPI0021CB1FEE|nr:acyl-CoA dehydrogenase family protein [Neobacillus niacini]MCM3764461.1 acyl-CoA dehydrogenase family protein [Neobacillus niacini]
MNEKGYQTVLVETRENFTTLLENARSLVPNLKARVQEVDEIRKLPEATINEMTELGLFNILTPERYGGNQLTFREYIDVVRELGKGCGSTAWVAALYNVAKWFVAAIFTDEVHQEVFKDNGASNICGVFEPRKCKVKKVPGGYLIEEGLWGFCSGSQHSDYFFLGFPLIDENGEGNELGVALIPKENVKILDDWHTISMRGTGSNSVTVSNVFVPENWTASISKGIVGEFPDSLVRGEASYNSGFVPVAALVLTAPGLGLVSAALDYFVERLPKRRIQYTWYNNQADAPVTHLQLAEAVMKSETAHLHVYRAANEIDRWAKEGKYMDFEARAKVRADCSYATRLTMEAIEILMSAGGGSAIAENNPLSRIMKDGKTPPQHGLLTPTTGLELYGRVLSEREPNTVLI